MVSFQGHWGRGCDGGWSQLHGPHEACLFSGCSGPRVAGGRGALDSRQQCQLWSYLLPLAWPHVAAGTLGKPTETRPSGVGPGRKGEGERSELPAPGGLAFPWPSCAP